MFTKFELSDITKQYLNSYLEDSGPSPELSDFSKAYITGLGDSYKNEETNVERPALSGLTMEFLNDNYEDNADKNKMEEIIEVKEEEKEDNNN